jgi:hypothetical protein
MRKCDGSRSYDSTLSTLRQMTQSWSDAWRAGVKEGWVSCYSPINPTRLAVFRRAMIIATVDCA